MATGTSLPIAWAYLRVSGDEQADRGVPIAGQRRAIQQYADAHGLYLERYFIDEAKSGKSDRSRDNFQNMMALAHADPPPCKVILLWSWARFARNQNDSMFWKASLRRHGIDIIDVSGETPDLPNGFSVIVEALIHWKDEQKLVEIGTQARRGQQTLASLGFVPSGCAPPRGFMVEFTETVIEGRKRRVRKWVPDPTTWPLAETAWKMRLQGASYRAINQVTHLFTSYSSYPTFFGNLIYKGELRFGDTVIVVPAMVTPEEWRIVNDSKEARTTGGYYARRKSSRFLLSGLAFCARCGHALSGDFGGAGPRQDGYTRQRWDCYVCNSRKGPHKCDLPRVSAPRLDQAVTDALLDTILTTETLAAQHAQITAQLDAERPALEAQLQAAQNDLQSVNRALEHLLDAIETARNSEALARRLTERETERADLYLRISRLQKRLDGPGQMPDVEALRTSLREALEHSPIDAREFLKTIITEIRVNKGEAILVYSPPFVPSTGIWVVPQREFESRSQP